MLGAAKYPERDDDDAEEVLVVGDQVLAEDLGGICEFLDRVAVRRHRTRVHTARTGDLVCVQPVLDGCPLYWTIEDGTADDEVFGRVGAVGVAGHGSRFLGSGSKWNRVRPMASP